MAYTAGDPAIDAILVRRARDLARAPEEGEEFQGISVITFSVGDHRYGIETAFVREVVSLQSLTAVPCTPEFVAGIVNIRGQLLSLVDLARFLDVPVKGVSDLTQILVVSAAGIEAGLLAHEVLGMRLIPESEVRAPLPNDENVAREFVFGVTPDLTVLLNVGKIFADPRLLVHEEVMK